MVKKPQRSIDRIKRVRALRQHSETLTKIFTDTPAEILTETEVTEASKEDSSPDKRDILEERLRDNIFLVGAGAWQHLWETKKQMHIGFGSPQSQDGPSTAPPNQQDLRSSIKPELLKRFRSQIVIMPTMDRNAYHETAKSIHDKLPSMYQVTFQRIIDAGIERAIEEAIGMRFFEESYTETLATDITNTL